MCVNSGTGGGRIVGNGLTMTYGAVLTKPGEIEIREFPMPGIDSQTGILRVELAGVCSGTDVKLYRGKLNNPFPIIMGHEIVGVVEKIGSSLAESNNVQRGDRVILRGSRCGRCKACRAGNDRFCEENVGYGVRRSTDFAPGLWGGYAQHVFLVPGAVLQKVPCGVTSEQALMAGILANGLYWSQKQGGVQMGTSVVVQGVGQQGLAAVMACRYAGAYPIVAVGLSGDGKRLQLAQEFGADSVVMADSTDVIEVVSQVTNGAMADVVIEVTGSGKSFVRALDLVRAGGTVVQGGLAGVGMEVSVPLDKIVWNQIRVQGVYSKPIEAVSLALDLLETGRLPIERIISHRFRLADSNQALALIEQGGDALKVVITPEVV